MTGAILFLHVVSGFLSLLTGTFVLIARKGGRKHVLAGRVFFYAMLVAGISSLLLAVIHPNRFLFVVGVFTVYMVTTGRRYILQARGGNKERSWRRLLLPVLMAIASAVFAIMGTIQIISGVAFGFVECVFAGVGLLFVTRDFRLSDATGRTAIRAHIQRMIGAYIAALTAFLVVNGDRFSSIPPVLLWLLPTALITPLIFRYSKQYRSA